MSKILRKSSLMVIEAMSSRIIHSSDVNYNVASIEFGEVASPDEICG